MNVLVLLQTYENVQNPTVYVQIPTLTSKITSFVSLILIYYLWGGVIILIYYLWGGGGGKQKTVHFPMKSLGGL